jgi:hypothetical protein
MAASGSTRFAPKRVAGVVVLAALAAGVAGALTLRRPQQYSVQTTVFVGRILPASGASVDSSIADFETVIGLPEVTTAVAKQTGASRLSIAHGISFQRVGASSAVQVSFHGSNAAKASNVVIAASHQALLTLAQQQVDGATEGVNAAQTATTAAQNAVTALDQRFGVANLQDAYQAQQQDLFNLENQLASASPGQSASLTTLIAQKTDQLNALGAALPQFQQLNDNLTQATSTLNTASQTLTDAKGKLDAAGSSTIVTSPNVVKQSRSNLLARASAATLVAVILLGVGLLILTDWMRTRNPTEPVAPAAPPAPPLPAAPRQRATRPSRARQAGQPVADS